MFSKAAQIHHGAVSTAIITKEMFDHSEVSEVKTSKKVKQCDQNLIVDKLASFQFIGDIFHN